MKEIIKIYFWQFVSITVNLGTIFISVPYFSQNKALYGIFTLIQSLYLFVTYTDFGFLSSGIKYATEESVSNKINNVEKILGFVAFIFSGFVLIFTLVFIILSFYPKFLIPSISNLADELIAKNLFLIFAISSPFFVFYRIFQIAFQINLKDYIFQKIVILTNSVKIVSTYFFFKDGKYEVVNYFIFSQTLVFFSLIIAGYYLHKNKLLDVKVFFKNFKFDNHIYKKVNNLAFASFFVTLSTLLYFEFDSIFIAKYLGPILLANFAVAKALVTYYRTFFGVLSTPFVIKINKLVGSKDFLQLNILVEKTIFLFLPLSVLPVLIFILNGKYLIINWLGINYIDSVVVSKLFVAIYLFSFLNSPVSILISSLERLQSLYLINFGVVIIYWVGVYFTYKDLGLVSLALFKLVVTFISFVFYIYILNTITAAYSNYHFVIKVIQSSIMPVLVIIFLYYFIERFYLSGNGISLLIWNIFLDSILFFIGLIVYYFSNIEFKSIINNLLHKFTLRFL